MIVVLDTSALIYWTQRADRLTGLAEKTIVEADRILCSSISVWEIALKVKRGRLKLQTSVEELVERLNQVERFEFVSVDNDIWIQNVELDWEHRDPADRTIVALAQSLDAKLVTSDRVMRAFYSKAVWQ